MAFNITHKDMGRAFDGPVKCTFVDKLSAANSKAVIYLHGYNDYVFNEEMADKFLARGYNFRGLDLRRHGRSWEPMHQSFNHFRDLKEAFEDIDAALERADEPEVHLLGHSTGGLIAAYYLNCGRGKRFKTLILNSIFIDWNSNWAGENIAVPLGSLIGRALPELTLQDGQLLIKAVDPLVYHLHKNYGGEWDFDLGMKRLHEPPKYAGWIRAISLAQDRLKEHKKYIKVPILSMYSDGTRSKINATKEDTLSSDIILDVRDIDEFSSGLGDQVSEVEIAGGVHDLFLSPEPIRTYAYEYMFDWLEDK